jgi:Zn-dependent protease with chaperone function
LLRLTPLTGGGLAAAILGVTFLRYEPGDTAEVPGLILLASAAITLAFAVAAAARGFAAASAARRCLRLVRECGALQTRPDGQPVWVLDTEYPVAAVMGIVRARLLLSRRILAECTEGEIDSVVRHELAHIRRRDNLVQAAMRFLPDPFAHTRIGREIQAAWAVAAEEAADDLAADGAGERTDLASALVRVARMHEGRAPAWVPALTFFERTTVESRVRRLLVSGPATPRRVCGGPLAVALAAASAIAVTEAFGLHLHTLMELAVQVLP